MKSEMNSRSKPAGLLSIFAFAFALAAIAVCIGCTTVVPETIHANAASWDGTNQNSGFIGWTNGQGIITVHAAERYTGLIAIYGKRFVPPLTPGYGLTPTNGVYWITPEAITDFAKMNRWRKAELH